MQSKQPEPQGYPLYIKGDIKIIDRIKLTLTTTLSLPKSTPISVPFVAKSKQITPLLEPIIHLETIDDAMRDQVMKGKYQLKPDTFYIYYPSQFRVDEKIYKALLKNYQNLVDQVPRNVKPFMNRLIIWEEGKGENSYEMQKFNINERLSETAKELIESKLNTFISQIKQYQSQPSSPKSLLHIFLLKNKLACLYSHLSLKAFAHDLLSDLWNQMMINFRVLMKLSPAGKFGSYQKLDQPQDIPKSPYTFENTNDILGYFESTHSTAYLRIVTHAFLKFYAFSLEMGLYFQALSKLKNCLDFILNNVLVLARRNDWTKQQMIQFDISRNLWAIEVIKKCLKDLQNTLKENPSTRTEDLSKIHVSICSMLRNSVERIGLILYQFDNYSIFPGNVQKELQFIFQKIKKIKEPWKNHKQSIESLGEEAKEQLVQKSASLMRREQFTLQIPEMGPNELKLRQLISERMVPPEEIVKILINFQTYSQVYLEVLQLMFISLKESPFGRVAKSLKLTMERATIILGDWEDYEKVKDEPEQFRDQWPQLHAIEELYRLFFLAVKLLAGDVSQNSTISAQLVKVITNSELKDEKNMTLRIAGLVNQIFELYGISVCIAKVKDLQITQDLSLCIIINEDLTSLMDHGEGWRLSTQQIMLSQGEKIFEIGNIQLRSFKKCNVCQGQCQAVCFQPGSIYTELKGHLQFKDDKDQALFYAKNLFFQISTQSSEKKLVLKLEIPDYLGKVLHQIHTPKMIFNHERDSFVVHSQAWTPVIIRLTNGNYSTEISKITVATETLLKVQNDPVEGANKVNFELSELVCIKSAKSKDKGLRSRKYCKIGEPLDLTVKESSQWSFVVFVKAKRPQKIQRNSKRRNQQILSNECLTVQLTLKSNRGNRSYQIREKTGNIIVKPLILIEYHVVQSYEQFTITNLRELALEISESTQMEKEQTDVGTLLQKDESVCVQSRSITISPLKYPEMKALINLNDWFDQQQLIQQKCNTFRLWYKSEHLYSVFRPIQIESELTGTINIPYLDESFVQGFEMVGKIHGEVNYTSSKCLDLKLIPIRTGNIVLPEIWINGKRGIWVNSLITNIQPFTSL